MNIVERFKTFFLKENFDFNRPDINIYNFHPQLRIIFAINGIFFNNRQSLYRFLWPFVTIGISLAGSVLEVIFTIHYLSEKDYSLATECFSYIVVLASMLISFISILWNKDNIYSVIERMNSDFIRICHQETKYRKQFLDGQLIIWKLCWVWFVFSLIVGFSFPTVSILSLCYQTLFSTQDEHTIRPLPFVMWLPYDDPYRTPNYEILLVFQTVIVACAVQATITYIYTMFHVLLHYNNLMDIIILHFDEIFDDLEESVALLSRFDQRRVKTQLILNKRIKTIVDMHISVLQAIESVSSLHGPVLVYQMMFSPIAICFVAFQVVEKLENGNIHILFFLLDISTIMQLWVPSYLGTKIRNKAFAVGDACWGCGWHLTSLGLLVRSDIITIIIKSQQPLNLKFTGLPNIELETFSALMSRSYSLFNMLRHYNK